MQNFKKHIWEISFSVGWLKLFRTVIDFKSKTHMNVVVYLRRHRGKSSDITHLDNRWRCQIPRACCWTGATASALIVVLEKRISSTAENRKLIIQFAASRFTY
jgi:hypothetical protein